MDQSKYNVFHRTFWKEATGGGWPNNLEPSCGDKIYLAHDVSIEEAKEICDAYNLTHDPGRYSDKAEFERE